MEWVAFDLNGTLLDPAAIAEPLPVADSGRFGRAILDETVTLAMAETLSGGYVDFSQILRAALERGIAAAGLDPAAHLEPALERAAALPPYPDAAGALDTLRGGGLRVAVVTNSSRESAERALDAAGLADRVELVVGADEARAFKPDLSVYRGAARRLGAQPGSICLVAAHAWDILGAGRAGWRTAWVARKEGRLVELVPPPDWSGDDLAAVAGQMIDAAE